jgi:hypothetical protein
MRHSAINLIDIVGYKHITFFDGSFPHVKELSDEGAELPNKHLPASICNNIEFVHLLTNCRRLEGISLNVLLFKAERNTMAHRSIKVSISRLIEPKAEDIKVDIRGDSLISCLAVSAVCTTSSSPSFLSAGQMSILPMESISPTKPGMMRVFESISVIT